MASSSGQMLLGTPVQTKAKLGDNPLSPLEIIPLQIFGERCNFVVV
jgi:hypothetical protein